MDISYRLFGIYLLLIISKSNLNITEVNGRCSMQNSVWAYTLRG